MQEILGPEGYLPGTTDNYVANEVIVASPRAVYVWPFLNGTTAWPTYLATPRISAFTMDPVRS